MRRVIVNEFNNLADRLSNNVGVMGYRFMNLCVKAEPVSLLPVKVLVEGKLEDLDKCSTIGKDGDYRFLIFPKFDEDILSIVRGIAESHPEFKIEGKSTTVESSDESGNDKTVDVKYLSVTMPDVDDNRYDVLKDGVDAVYQECKAQMEQANEVAKPKFAELMVGESKENIDLLDNELKKLNKQWEDHREKLHQAKLDEIEEAHNKWLAEQEEQLLQRTEQENARGEEAAHSMRMDYDNNE